MSYQFYHLLRMSQLSWNKIESSVKEHLSSFQMSLPKYFSSNFTNGIEWITRPFSDFVESDLNNTSDLTFVRRKESSEVFFRYIC